MRRTRTARQHRAARHDTGGPLRSVASTAALLVGGLALPAWPLVTVAAAAAAVTTGWAVCRNGWPTGTEYAASEVPAEPSADPR